MKNLQKITKLSTITLILMLTFATAITVFPAVFAHDPPWTIPTYAYIKASPDTIGVNQTAYLSFWIDKMPPAVLGSYGPRWHDMTVTIEKPDGTTELLGTYDSDGVGGAWDSYVPDQIGTYIFEFSFPEQVAIEENMYPYGMPSSTDTLNDTFTASTATTTLTVQETAIETAYPGNPLPTEFWARPINSMNREWSSIGGNWLGLSTNFPASTGGYGPHGNFNPYTTAPDSSHILWTRPYAFGGQIGGEFGSDSQNIYATGTAYETKFAPVIINGILYYTSFAGASNNGGVLTAVDLRTGETLWTVDTPNNTLKCGMVYNLVSGDQYGGYAYLITETFVGAALFDFVPPKWSMYNAMDGKWILDIAPPPGAWDNFQLMNGPNGELLGYGIPFFGTELQMWNITKCIEVGSLSNNFYFPGYANPVEMWRPPDGATLNFTDGYEWSAPLTWDISGVPIVVPQMVATVSDGVVLVIGEPKLQDFTTQTGYRIEAGYDADTGNLLWGPINRTLTPFTTTKLTNTAGFSTAGEGVYTEYTSQTMTWVGYSIETGEKLWGPTEPYSNSYGFYNNEPRGVIGYGNLYTYSFSGEVRCYDVQTGEEKWNWNAGSSGIDTPYGIWPLGTYDGHYILADGKFYVAAGHDFTPPLFKGAKLFCLDALTGEEVWSSLSFTIANWPAVSDGVMVWPNGYDNQIYAYGKGPTKTTVTVSPKVSMLSDSVIIEGTVIDESPGTKEYSQVARFPQGVPAIADEDMSAWMEHIYQQQLKPTDAKGVEVSLDVIDANGNFRNIGSASSDASGFFSYQWTPDIPGKYTVIATFAGSGSYYASYAETAFGIDEAPQPTPPPEATPAPMTDTYLAGSTIAIIAAIGIAVFLILRKK